MDISSIDFPNLGINLHNVGKSVEVFGLEIAFYGIIIAAGVLLGILTAEKEAKRTNQNPDDYTELAIYAIIFSIIGARIYFVIFTWDNYKNDLLSILNTRQGGLAIYGGIIAAFITLFVFTKKKKLSFFLMADTGCQGLLVGQIIGRWGNFFNREAFGTYTDGLFAMRLPIDAVRPGDISNEIAAHIVEGTNYIQVHPTFLYESLWNLGALLFITFYKKHKKFDGELFLLYLLLYGVGRAWIEGLRTDQLLIPAIHIPVSQVLSIILVILSIVLLIVKGRKRTI